MEKNVPLDIARPGVAALLAEGEQGNMMERERLDGDAALTISSSIPTHSLIQLLPKPFQVFSPSQPLWDKGHDWLFVAS